MARRKWSGAAKRAVKRYNSYRRSFEKRTNKMISQGLTPYDAIPLTYREYKEIYVEEKNDRIKEIEKGERSSLGDINAKIISDQVYELSEEQAYAIFDYMKTLSAEEREELNFSYKNINAAIAKIRQGDFVREDLDLWDIIQARRDNFFNLDEKKKTEFLDKWKNKLLKEGKAPTFKNAVNMEISHTFFGSK